ncbi:MAG: bifunctional 4-hydroxy-2-oxoglutarate aldolase/2-dehydro-3-deoxy-phosphogluconate aldolase [Alkalispirochaeta sp.]
MIPTFPVTGVVPVVVIQNPVHAVPLARALLAGGIPSIEVTLRSEAGLEAIRRIAAEVPQIGVGAGTVTDPASIDQVRDAGATFAVAPGCNPEVIAAADRVGLPFAPGVATPTELERALSLGCHTVKVFPAVALGGPAYLKAMVGPYRHLGMSCMPTGGITAESFESWLAIDVVSAVGGSWIAPAGDIEQERWSTIEARAREIHARVEEVSGG